MTFVRKKGNYGNGESPGLSHTYFFKGENRLKGMKKLRRGY